MAHEEISLETHAWQLIPLFLRHFLCKVFGLNEDSYSVHVSF